MKHIFIGILTISLCITFLPLNALAAPGDALLLPLENGATGVFIAQSLAVVGDTLYILRPDEGLYLYHVGDEEPAMLIDLKKYDAVGTEKTEADDLSLRFKSYQQMSAPDEVGAHAGQPAQELVWLQYLVSGGDKLYALEYTCERLWALNETQGVFELALELDISAIKSKRKDQYWINAYNHRIVNGCLYMLVNNYDTSKPALKKIDLATGAVTGINIGNVYDYAPYKDGKLLVGMGEWETNEIGILDPETGSYEKKMDVDAYGYYGLQYDGETDAHYMLSSVYIRRSVAFGEWENAAYIPVTDYSGLPCALMPGGYLAVGMPDSVQVRNIDPRYLPERPLKLSTYSEDLSRIFAKENPGILITYADRYYGNMEELVANMMGFDASDVYMIDSADMDLHAIYKKGYLADLSGNQAITEIVNRMYPNIRESLTFDGKIVAIPFNMNVSTFGVNLKTLKKIGLTGDDAPRTYFELLEFIKRWINGYSAEYPDLKLFEFSENLSVQLMNAILNAQMTYCNVQGEPLTFDTPVMRKLLAKLESIDFTPLSEYVSFEDGGDVQEWEIADSDGSTILFILSNPITIDRYAIASNRAFEPALLALDDGMPALLDAQVSWLILNQKSADNEEAMRFMQYCAEHMYPSTLINTMPDENEPIEDAFYVQFIESSKEQLSILETLLEMADEGIKPFIETDIQNEKLWMENLEKDRWAASPEDIARYRSLYDHISIAKPNLLFSRYNDEITTLINRYVENQIKGDQFIMELSQKLYMMQMEG